MLQLPVSTSMGLLLLLALVAALLVSGGAGLVVGGGDSPVICSSEGVECDYNQTNLLSEVTHVYTLTQCRQLCLDDGDCHYISYYDDNAFPISHLCQLFQSCESVSECSDCISENVDCSATCGSNTVGAMDENILSLTPFVESEAACKAMCVNNAQCLFYTYFFGNATLHHQDCYLLSELLPPTVPCDRCVTGPRDCADTEPCSLELNGESYQQYQSLMLTNTSEIHTVTVKGSSGCEIRFLAVGGGGRRHSDGDEGAAGSGSGYLEYRQNIKVDPGTIMYLAVGGTLGSSTVEIYNGNAFSLAWAWPGHAGQSVNGGAGYCGGGGWGTSGGDGGTDGGDGLGGVGPGGAGGGGQGGDLSLYTFTSWSLAPGAGGHHYGISGGGGGGLLVNGGGPEASEWQGQGFGGGGNGFSDYSDGLQGVILLEITSL